MDQTSLPDNPIPGKPKWYYHPAFVILMLIFVLGPFGLPLLYKSPRFTQKWKVIWTIIMIVVTLSLIGGTIKAGQFLVEMIQSIQAGK